MYEDAHLEAEYEDRYDVDYDDADVYGGWDEGPEDYEPSPYDGTYSEC